MTIHEVIDPVPPTPHTDAILKLAVLAVGGQGGGVLTGWIEVLARAHGYAVQATSVAGVAQRTGSTLYYIEMCPVLDSKMGSDRQPVFSLMPAAGDVDIMIASEMMEAGRSIIRGFVTPDRTTLITSTHRALAVSEKMVPGDGIASSAEVMATADLAARRVIAADFDALAIQQGSVISASLFGALAASAALPFPVAGFEDAIKAGGKGTAASLRAFQAGFAAALTPAGLTPQSKPTKIRTPRGPATLLSQWQTLQDRVARLPANVAELARPGLQKVVDFQDVAYGAEYLDRIETILARDTAAKGHALTREAAKYIANAMAYDDVIRVADLKTRAARSTRIAGEMGLTQGKLLHVTEYFHPRAEEIIGMMPARLGARLDGSPSWTARIDRLFNKGRHLRSDGLPSFLMLHALAALRPRRRRNFRHAQEQAHLTRWLDTALNYLPDYDLAVETLKCRRLIKGYSDTHARGLSKFDRVLAGIASVKHREDAPDWARRLREAALKDEEGQALDGALKTIASFS